MLAGSLALLAFGMVSRWPILPHPGLLLTGALASLLLWFCWPRLGWLLWITLLLVFVWRAADWGTTQLNNRLNSELEGIELLVDGYVDGLPHNQDRYQRFDFRIQRAAHADGRPIDGFPRKIRLSSYDDQKLAGGEGRRLRVKLKQPRGMQNPGAFDYELWLMNRGIGAAGYVRDVGAAEHASQWRAIVARTREYLRQQFIARLQAHPRVLGVVLALGLGDRSHLDVGAADLVRRAGLSHLLAISGLHVGLVAGLGFMLGRTLGGIVSLFLPTRVFGPRWGVTLGCVLAAFYALLTGLGIPAQRALIMLAVGSIWYLRMRRSSVWQGWWLALVLVLCWQPLAVQEAGFWFSFAAVAVLLLYSGRHMQQRASRLRSLILTQLALFLSLAGLQLFWGLGISIHAVWVNLLAVPFISLLVVPLILLAIVILLLHLPLAGITCKLLAMSLGIFWSGVDSAEKLVGLEYYLPALNLATWQLLLLSVAVVLLLMPLSLPYKGLALVSLLLTLWDASQITPDSRIAVLDVGQGLAVVAESRGQTLLYDTGPAFSERFDAGNAVVLPYLRTRKVNQLDYLIVSHNDLDHRGGLASIEAGLPVDLLLRGEADPDRGNTEAGCDVDRQWQMGLINVSILALERRHSQWNSNNQSCVVLLDIDGFRVLLPGDIESGRERELVQHPLLQSPVDVLLAPHHGSKTSSSPSWVRQLRPARVIFSAGYRSRYGHPHPSVLARYRKAGADVSCTSATGAQFFRFEHAGRPFVSYQREAEPRYWRFRTSPDCDADRQS